MSTQDTIQVVCRFRPQNNQEIAQNGQVIVDFDDNMTAVKSRDSSTYQFDRVFDWNHTQADVFKYSARTIVEDIMNGYNGTIFCYGQTGSGKTYTMMGDEDKGLTPRIVEKIFDTIVASNSDLEFTVKVSFMEIYMERIKDLLNPMNDNLPIHEDKQKGVYVKGMLELFVGSMEEVFEVMRRGQENRVTASTLMNSESSRSHSIFTLLITQKNIETGSTKTGKLSLVDLAGSEKVGKTGATGQTLEEAKKINKSLSALGMVINALTDGKSSHVPYRDSKLTRILQESLGGNSRTTLIINCSPSSLNEAETISTLRFGMRAKNIKNKAKINQELSPAELKSLLKKAKLEISLLEEKVQVLNVELLHWRSGQDSVAEWKEELLTNKSQETLNIQIDTAQEEEFLKRENELQDQLAEREKELSDQRLLVLDLEQELKTLKERDGQLSNLNKELTSQFNDLKLKMEKLDFEAKESVITMDSLKESNAELESQIEKYQKQILELQLKQDDGDDTENRKIVMMKHMMDQLDLGVEEQQLRDTVLKFSSSTLPPTDPTIIEHQHYELEKLKQEKSNDQTLIQDLELQLQSYQSENELLSSRKYELEQKLHDLELEYEQLLEKNIQDEEHLHGGEDFIHDLKAKLEIQYSAKKDLQDSEYEDLKLQVLKKQEEIDGLKKLVQEHVTKNEELIRIFQGQNQFDPEMELMRKNMQSQLIEFEAMKKKLMKDLQDRCEKVVELELSLDETRQQYQSVVTNSQSRVQQKKMQFLERNLEQLTNVQKQLVEQNSSLKKQALINEKKLETRNERIEILEAELQQAQQSLNTQDEQYQSQIAQLQARVKELEHKQGTPWIQSSKIAKPLRGGLAKVEEENVFLETNVAASPRTLNSKRSSWYISLLKK